MGVCYVFVSVFLAQVIVLIGSTAVTWASPMISKLKKLEDNPLGRTITETEDSWLSSLPILGACFGAVIVGALSSKFGKKSLLISLGFPYVICYLVMAWAETIWELYIGRFVTGLGLGGSLTLVPMYTGELADVKNRGILGASIAVFANIGMLIPYCIGPYISYFWFHIILAIIPGIYILLFSIFSPESPYYLIRNNHDKAENVVRKLRRRSDASATLKEIEEDMKNNESNDGSLMEVFRDKGLRKAFIIGLGEYTFLQLTGTGIVAAYSQSIFEDAGSNIAPELCPIIVGTAQLITTMIISCIADRFPRKFLLTISHLGVAAVEIPFGVYFFLKDKHYDVSNISSLPLICLILYVSLYNVGIGPVILTLLGELYPTRVKAKAVSCMILYCWTASFILTFLFNTLKDLLGMGVLFCIFSASGFSAVIFIKFCIIETKGKTFQEIQDKLNA